MAGRAGLRWCWRSDKRSDDRTTDLTIGLPDDRTTGWLAGNHEEMGDGVEEGWDR